MTSPLSLRINNKLKERLLVESYKHRNKSLSRYVEGILKREMDKLDKTGEDLKLIGK